MLTPAQQAAFAAAFPGLRADSALADSMRSYAVAAHLPAGRAICQPGDSCSHLALLTEGSARVYSLAESGREITLYRVEPGECCILTASCILSDRPFPAMADSDTPLDAVLVPAGQVVAWMSVSEAWRQFLWSLLAGRLGAVIGLVEEVAFRRMDSRLAEYLANQAGRDGVLAVTHGQIAAELGTSREVVSRLLKDLEQRGLVRLGRGRVEIVDAAGLGTMQQIGD